MRRYLSALLFLSVVLTPVQTGWKQLCKYQSHDTKKLFQGLLYRNGELFQIFHTGMVNVLDANTMEFKRSFQLPHHGHYSSVEWLDDNRFATVERSHVMFVTDISDESHITCDSITLTSLNPVLHKAMSALAYDRENKILYAGGYSPDINCRLNVVVDVLDLSGYMDGTSKEIPLIDSWTVPSYHIQDACFYKGLIWHLSDKSIGQASKPYDCLRVYALDPRTKSVVTTLDVPLSRFTEAQGLYIFDDKAVVCDVIDKRHCHYYSIDIKFDGTQVSEEQLLSPRNPGRNALCAGYGLYDFTSERVSKPAPEGYEPFYMVHYGRHGARYLSEAADYELIHNVFTAVPDEGFTPLGRALAARYNLVYPQLKGRGGDLSETGKRQLSALGKRYHRDFPQIFSKGATVLAECSKVPRCIVSASYFCDALDDEGCKVNLDINSAIADSMIRRKWYPKERDAYTDSLLRARVDVEGICKRLFTEGSTAVKGDAASFVRTFWALSCDMPNTDFPEMSFSTAFSYEDLVALKSVEDDMYRFGRRAENNVETEYSRVLLDHLFKVASEDIKSGSGASARLFFGHDTPLMSLICLIDPDGLGKTWSTSDIPVAANLRIIFYRRGENVIYKVQLNESDITDYIKFQ